VLDLEDWTGGDSILNKADYLLWVTSFLNRVKNNPGTGFVIYSRKEYLDRKFLLSWIGHHKLWCLLSRPPDCNRTPSPFGPGTIGPNGSIQRKGQLGNSPVLDINILKDSTPF